MKVSKVNYRDIKKVLRLDGSYHLSEGVIYLKKLRELPHVELQYLSSKIFTAGRNKRVYTDKEFGFPYLSNSDVSNSNPFNDCKYNSKKYACDENAFLKKGMIVTGRVGAIGQTSYITSEFEDEKAMGSDNIIRIVPNDFELSGYIYAFLTSKFGNTLLWQLSTGGVQPYISEEMLHDLPIPVFPEEKQKEIHNLIIEASNLRVKANSLLKEAITEIESKFQFHKKETVFTVNVNQIKDGDKYTSECRLESDYYQPATQYVENQIKKNEYALLGDLSESVTISNLRARTFVEKGITLFTGQSLGQLKPDMSKQMSKKLTKNIERNTTIDGDILVSAFGTLGKTEFCYKNFYTGIFASQQIAKIKVNNEKIDSGYIYLFLKSKIGQSLILKYKTGSVIEWANWNNFSSILIPIPKDKGKALGDIARQIATTFESSYQKENEAIGLIEKEIELWQKS